MNYIYSSASAAFDEYDPISGLKHTTHKKHLYKHTSCVICIFFASRKHRNKNKLEMSSNYRHTRPIPLTELIYSNILSDNFPR